MPRVEFSPRSSLDLEEIGDYIARDNSQRAESFLEELKAHCFRIAESPAAYPSRDDIGIGLKMAVHGRYLIFFRITRAGIRISRIIHGARRVPRSI